MSLGSERVLKVPRAYASVWEEARRRKKRYLEKGLDVSLFRLMVDIEKERSSDDDFKVFRL